MNGDIEISALDGESCAVRCGRSNFRLRALPSAGHPPSFAVEDNIATAALRAGDAKRLFGDVATAACSESMRAHVNGVCLFSDVGHLGAVAADGICLQFRITEAPYCGPCVMVPLSACELAVRLFAKSSAPSLRTNGRLIEIATENARIVSKLVDASFPENWRAIVPELAANAATFSVAELTRALQRIATIASKVDTVTLSWDEAVGGEAAVTLDGVSSADDFVVASGVSGRAALRFDAAMMLNLVGAVDVSTVRISAKPQSTIRLDAPGRRDLALLAPRLLC
jgi:DNA polymerase III sliding clamp (beta) subunit (PCNA family)